MELVKISSIFVSSPNCNRIKRFPNPRSRRGSGAMKLPRVYLSVSGSSGRKSPLAASVGGGKSAVAEKPTVGDFKVFDGMPAPLGAVARDGGVNFAICSSGASSATLCLFSLSDLKENRVTELIPLDPLTNKTGNIWHVFLEGEFEDILYGYKFDGKFCSEDGHYFDDSRVLLDPYAKAVIGRAEYGVPGPGGNCWPQMACMIPLPDNKFDWQGDLPLHYPQKDLIIYEMHVRGYTKHESSKTDFPGTYLGAVDKLDHLKELGVNCIELMPCQEFNELEYFSHDNPLGENRLNFWGYSTVNYFSPMMRYSFAGITNCGYDTINEFKAFVREAHKRGIEVLLDVVFNHTAEGNENGPILSFRGVDNNIYYMVAPKGEFYNYSGCGNTFNCNHPIVRQFILDCLRYWVTEMHVDGFRFDLASIMTRGSSLWDAVNVYGIPIEGDTLTTGTPLSNPPLIDMISNDPVLHGIKLIAEAWDAGGLYQVGHFPHWSIWSEWNGQVMAYSPQSTLFGPGRSSSFSSNNCSPNGPSSQVSSPLSTPLEQQQRGSDDDLELLYVAAGRVVRLGLDEDRGPRKSDPHHFKTNSVLIQQQLQAAQYRDTVRQFIKGTDGFSGAFAGSLCGSPNLYQEGGRKPWNSINFVCAHDGFTLADLVTYNNKNNLSNGEENNDGENHNLSWNCGEEGEFASITVRKLRKRQMRNFFLCLMVSQGVPMIHMGDEYGHTKGGNNNTYCHDNYINYFRWDKKEQSSSDFFRFCHLMTKFRQECESLGLEDFPTADRLQWHGHQPGAPDWSETSRFVAFSMIDSVKRELYIAFNTSHLPVTVTLPERPGYRWEPLVDTSKPTPYDFLRDDLPDRNTAIRQYANFLDSNLYPMLSYSSVILTLQPDDA